MTDTLTVIISAAVGAVVAYLGAVWQTRLEARRVIHERVHQSRARLYPSAWKLTGALPRRPRTEEHSYGSLSTLAIELRDWYYVEGGIYLSGAARRAYSVYQDTISEVTANREPNTELDEQDYEKVRKAGSQFRTWLTRDLLSRSRAPMTRRWKIEST
jgi:hypothetical protein